MSLKAVIELFNDCLIQSAWSYRMSELFLITDGDLVVRITPSHTYGISPVLSYEIMERHEFEELRKEVEQWKKD